MRISGICPSHGYYKGQECPKCVHGETNETFHTTKDQLYYFTDYKNFSQPLDIHGKDHWNRELKKRGLTDDKISHWPTKSRDEKRKDYAETIKKNYTRQRIEI